MLSQEKSDKNKIFKDITLNCPSGKKGYGYCLDCENISILCADQSSCKCYVNHKTCQNFKRIQVFNSVLEGKIKKSKVINHIAKKIEQMIDQLSKLQQGIKNHLQNFGLNQADKQISQKIVNYGRYKQQITSKDFKKYEQEYLQKEKIWFAKETSHFNNLLNGKSVYLKYKLGEIYNLIYYEHVENTNNIQNIFFIDSNILAKKTKQREMLIQMIKPLGEIKRIQKVFSIDVDKFTLKNFYNKCQKRSNLLYVVENQESKVYGAFCPLEISQNYNNYYVDSQNKTFLFDLDNNIKSKLLKNQKTLRIYSPQESNNYKRYKNYFLCFGDQSYPNLVISQDSKKQPNLNYISFSNCQNSNSRYYQDLTEKKNAQFFYGGGGTSRNNVKLKQFQIYQLYFQ